MLLLLLPLLEDSLLGEVARVYKIGTRLDKIERLFRGKRNRDPREVFRGHLARTGDVVRPPDIKHRERLDLLLGGLSALLIGGLHATPDRQLGTIESERIKAFLENPVIAAWYERFYEFAPPVLLRVSLCGGLPEEYLDRWRHELAASAFETHYRHFLLLDQRFVNSDVLGNFLLLLDDFDVDGVHLEDLHWALQDPQRLAKWVRKRRHLAIIEAMESFFDFAEDLDAFLAELDDLPLLRGQVWLHYAYWLGSGGKRMADIVEWLEQAIVKVEPNEEAGVRLRRTIARLRDPAIYPVTLLQTLTPVLDRWMISSGIARQLQFGQMLHRDGDPRERG